jgi:DNA-binding NarL/FixJ family response regulator
VNSTELRETIRRVCTPRQAQVMLMYDSGLSQRKIARRLRISKGTVADHMEAAQRRIEAAGKETDGPVR